jgi:hypothetical protein
MAGFSHRALALLVVAALLFVVGICAGEQTQMTPQLEVSEACCAFTQCSMLSSALLGVGLLATGAYLRSGTTPPVRSAVEDLLSPPPELIVFGSA